MDIPKFKISDTGDGKRVRFNDPVTDKRVRLRLWEFDEKVPPSKQGIREAKRRAPDVIRRYLGDIEIQEAVELDKVVTVGDWIAKALQDPGKKGTLSKPSQDIRLLTVRSFSGWLAQHRGITNAHPVTKITTRIICEFIDSRKAAGNSEITVRRYFGVIRRAFGWMIANDEIHGVYRNPAVRFQVSESIAEKSRRFRDKSMTDQVLQTLLDRVDDTLEVDNRGTVELRPIAPYYMRPALLILSKTGMRPGELEQAEWKDVDWNQRVLRIRKGKTGARIIVLNDDLMQFLRDRWEEVKEFQHTHILCLAEGGHLKRGTLTQAFKRYRDKIGIEGDNTSLYGLRHRYGHKLAEALPVNRVAAAMGHTQITTTMVYIRAEVEDIADEVRGVSL